MSPWNWRPSKDSWYERIEESSSDWNSGHLSKSLLSKVRTRINDEAVKKSAWLHHPFCSSLVAENTKKCFFNDAQFLAWLSFNCSDLDGTFEFEHPVKLWSLNGSTSPISKSSSSGELRELINGSQPSRCKVSKKDSKIEAPVMLFNDAVEPAISQQVSDQLKCVLGSIPAIASWINESTILLDVIPEGYFPDAPPSAYVSCSSPDLPGFIRVSAGGDILTLLEMIAHETAHQYLFRFERRAPIIEHGDGGLHMSPLREAPRPLRGVILAMHACAYIAAAYTEAANASVDIFQGCEEERTRVMRLFEESREIVDSAYAELSASGREFVSLTDQVAEYANRP